MKAIALALALLAVLLGASAFAQSPSFAEVCESQDIPTMAEYESNPGAYADNFCALATYAPQRVIRQLNSMIKLVRHHDNPNRFYFDSRMEPGYRHIQLLRPWMAEQGWWVRWSEYSGVDADFWDDGFLWDTEFWYFREDQQRYGNDDQFQIWLSIGSTVSSEDRDGITYYTSALIWGGERMSRWGLISGEIASDSSVHFRIRTIENYDDLNPNVEALLLGPSLIRAGVHAVLDCLEDPVIFYQYIDGDCDSTVDFGQPLVVASDGALKLGSRAKKDGP